MLEINQFEKDMEMAEEKLFLLYIFDKLNSPITSLQIIRITIEYDLMNYFYLQQYLHELSEDKLLDNIISEGKEFYLITNKGKEALSYFLNLVPLRAKIDFDKLIPEIRKSLKNESSVTASVKQVNEHEYEVYCRLSEGGFTLMELKIAAGNKNDAYGIGDNWKSHPEEMYHEITQVLLGKKRLGN